MWSSLRFLSSVAVLVGTAHADNRFQVEPTRVDLSGQAPAGAVIVTNHGADPLRIQIDAMRWTDDVDGVQQLTETKDLVVRPSLVEIAPGKSKTIRIGTVTPQGEQEGSYRVFIAELPDHTKPQSAQIQVLTRLGVPVFIAPTKPSVTLVPKVSVAGGQATVVVANQGTRHVKLAKVRVVGVREGQQRWDHEGTGWYVLAGHDRRFVVDVGADDCRAGDRTRIELIDEDGEARTQESPCRP